MPRFSAIPNQESYFERVWDFVRQIPAGKVITYGEIALLVSPPEGVAPHTYQAFGPRWVGSAMAHCLPDVPWQRVVNAKGRISPRKGDSALRQRELLKAEGVQFDEKDRINLKKYGWTPDSPPTTNHFPL